MKYPTTSPYHLTNVVNGKYLDVMVNRPLPVDPTDQYWTITEVYNLRPDLLAYDLYNDSKLWWVFAQRNPNKLPDPLFSFRTGVSIYVPKLGALSNVLGI
jgi:hypothetical protein